MTAAPKPTPEASTRANGGAEVARDQVESPAAAVDNGGDTSPPPGTRAARTPAWAWVVMTLMAALALTGAVTWAVVHNANPSTPAAVKDMQTLTAELDTLNSYLATTNSLMSNAITNSQQMSAKAQSQLAAAQTQLAAVEAQLGQERAALGNQLSGKTRNKLAEIQGKLQSNETTLSEHIGRLQQQQLDTVRSDVGAIGRRVGVATSSGSSAEHSIDSRISALERQVKALTSEVQTTSRLQSLLDGRWSGTLPQASLIRAGVASALAAKLRGSWTAQLGNGRFLLRNRETGAEQRGTFAVQGGSVHVVFTSGAGVKNGETADESWTISGGRLTFTRPTGQASQPFDLVVWSRV